MITRTDMSQLELLAQFHNLRISCRAKQLLEFSRKLDVKFSVPDDPPTVYSGQTCLHFATDVAIVKDLIERGADLFKQASNTGCTPLLRHAKICFWRVTGRLEENPVINFLLSEQIKSGNNQNIKNNDGMSHLHVASTYNHSEGVNFLKESINDALYTRHKSLSLLPGYTALHFAVRYSAVEAAEILLKNAADIHLKDANGVSPVHLLINRLQDATDFVRLGERRCCLAYHREITHIEALITLLINTREASDFNFVDDTGLSAFHLASCLKDSSIVDDYLKRNSDLNMQVHSNSMFWSGWTPLHFAACFSPDTFKLLLLKGSDVNIKNSKGESPLDMFMSRFPPEVIHSTLSAKDEFKNILLSDMSINLLDVIFLMSDCDKFSTFLQTLPDVNISTPSDSPLLPGYSLLHLAVSMRERKNLGNSIYPKTASEKKLPPVYNCSQSDVLIYWKRIVVCLAQRCSLTAKNSDGLTPIHLAFKLGRISAVEKLINCCKDDAVDPRGLSHLHIACAVGNESFVKQCLNDRNVNRPVGSNFEWLGKTFSDETMFLQQMSGPSKPRPYSVPVSANSTALHLAVIFGKYEIVEYLLDHGADVYAKNALGLTPIHLSMANPRILRAGSPGSKDLALLLLRKTPDIRESVTQHGLSHLHVAAFADDPDAVEKLIVQGSDVDLVCDIPKVMRYSHERLEYHLNEFTYLVAFAGQTPLHVAVTQKSPDAVRLLIRHNADIHASASYQSPVQCLLDDLRSNVAEHFVRKFKRDRLEVGAIDSSNVTALHIACARFDLKLARKLLELGADVDAQLCYDDKSSNFNGDTPLHFLVREAGCDLVRRKPAGTAKLVKLMLLHGADVTVTNATNETALHSAYMYLSEIYNDMGDENADAKLLATIADLMLASQKSYAVNPVNECGFSHFHYACLRNTVEIVEKFLNNGVCVDQRTHWYTNFRGFAALHFACDYKATDVARILIDRGADVKIVDGDGNLPLHVAMRAGFVDAPILESMLKLGVDVNAKNLSGTTPLDFLMDFNGFKYEQLKLLVDNGALMGVESPRNVIESMTKNAAPKDRQLIAEELLNACSVKSAIENGFLAIHNVVSILADDAIPWSANDYIHLIDRLVEKGCDLDMQDSKGNTALHQAVDSYNPDAVQALLSLGADLNIHNAQGESPFSIRIIESFNANHPDEIHMLTMLDNHVRKMKLLGLYVSVYNEDAAKKTTEYFRVRKSLKQKIMNELQLVNSTKINSCTIASAVRNYFSMAPAERKVIDDYFSRAGEMRQKFPEFAGLLQNQYTKLVTRKKLLGSAQSAFDAMCQIVLPDLCSNVILSYLKNFELTNLIKTSR